MAKIYVTVSNEGVSQQFTGTDGKRYDKLWTIERKLTGNMQLMGATINGELRAIDMTLPTEVKKVPKGAVGVSDETAERLWRTHSHYFGE